MADEYALPDDVNRRLNAVRRDIYNRHFRNTLGWDDEVDPDPSMDAAAQRLLGRLADKAGAAPGAWNSARERQDAMDRFREQRYQRMQAMGGQELQDGLAADSYLMDPRTADWWTRYGRDMDFLSSAASGDELGALERWDRNAAPLYRSDWRHGNMQGNDNAAQLLANLLQNRDSWVAGALHYSDAIPNALRWMGSGELPTDHHVGDFVSDTVSNIPAAVQRSMASLRAGRRYGLHNVGNQSAIVDTGPGSTAQEQKARQRELTDTLKRAEMGTPQQRWQQTAGWAPSEGVAMLADLPVGAIDQTTAMMWPLSAARLGAANFAKAAAADAMADAKTSAGLLGAMSLATGGAPWLSDPWDPNDATRQYWLGTGRPVQGKSDEQMQDTDEAQRLLGNLLPPVSTAVGKYVRRDADGSPAAAKPPESGLPSPQGQAYNRTGIGPGAAPRRRPPQF